MRFASDGLCCGSVGWVCCGRLPCELRDIQQLRVVEFVIGGRFEVLVRADEITTKVAPKNLNL